MEVLNKVPIRERSRFEEQTDVHRLIALRTGIAKMLTEGIYEPALEESFVFGVIGYRSLWISIQIFR